MRTPCAARLAISCSWATCAILCQRFRRASEARPPVSASRSARDGTRRRTIIRCPTVASGLGPPTSPSHADAETRFEPSGEELPPAATATETAVATSATTASSPIRSDLARGRVGIELKVPGIRDGLAVPRRGADHRGVVGAEWEWRERSVGKCRAKLGVGGDSAHDCDALVSELSGGRLRPLDERPHDRPLVGRGEVGAPALELVRREVADRVEQGGLEPGKREVEAGHACDREGVRLGVAVACEAVELGAPGVAQAEQAGALVERLPGGVVERRADAAVTRAVPDVEKQRVASAREQAEKGRLDGVGLKVQRGDVTVEMVDRDDGEPLRPRQRLRGRQPDEQRADQARAGGDRDAVDVVEGHVRLLLGLAEHREHELEMPARGHLGHDAPESGVEVRLRGDDIRPDVPLLGDERSGRFVAGGLERQNHRWMMPGARREHRWFWLVCLVGGAVVLIGCVLPTIEVGQDVVIGAGDTQRGFDYDRTIRLLTYAEPGAVLFVLGGISLIGIAAAALARGSSAVLVIAAAVVSFALVVEVARVSDQLRWTSSGVYVCEEALEDCAPFVAPAVRDLQDDIAERPEAADPEFDLSRDGYRARGRAGWRLIAWASVVLALLTAFGAFRLVLRPVWAGVAVALGAAIFLFVLFVKALEDLA